MSQDNNPFRRASMLQGTGFAAYLSNETVTSPPAPAPAPPPPPPESLVPQAPVALSNSEKSTGRPVSACPEYTPRAPESHTVVPAPLVARMTARDDDREHVACLAMGLNIPKYPDIIHYSNDFLPKYDEVINSTNRGYNPAYAGFAGYDNTRETREAMEARRREIEETNRLRRKFRKATGIWSCFRCCVPKDKTAGSRMKVSTKKILAACFMVLLIVVIPVVIIKVVMQKGGAKDGTNNGTGEVTRLPAQLFELPGFPPIPIGAHLVQPAALPNTQASCVSPPELWSCNLPAPATDPIPDFRFEIRYRPVDRQKDGPESIWAPRPDVPAEKDYKETSNIDSYTNSTAGIATGFVISMTFDNKFPEPNPYSSETIGTLSKRTSEDQEAQERAYLEDHLVKRQSLSEPSQNPPNMLPPLFRNQPLRLIDRGLPSEHYTAHIYFQKSIYLDSINMSSQATIHNNEVAGFDDKAKYACIWSDTRFKVQIFTRKNQDLVLVDRDENRFQIDSEFGKSMVNSRDPILPYPVTISEDRVSGSEHLFGKNIACWEILKNEHGNGKKLGSKRIVLGERKINTSLTAKGLDGRKKEGCFCEWGNWKERTKFDRERI